MIRKHWMHLVIFVTTTALCGANSLSFITKNRYNSTLQVSTKHGVIQGKQVDSTTGTSYLAYLGVPFAAPPLKSFRFRSPQPVKPWKGVLDTTEMRSGCVEVQLRFIGDILQTAGSEDCLYLNVYTPIRRSRNKYYPVIFYIYGGAFIEGSSKTYRPDYLIQHDLIIVNFNYRGGMFGFLSTEDKASYGNYGLKDQFAALKWVSMNIKQFGGDPKRVAMVGHSSGSVSAMYQMIYPKSWGLYCGVIGLSGDMSGSLGTQKYPRRTAFDIGLKLGIKTDNSTELVESLQKMDINKLIQAQKTVILVSLLSILDNGLPFTPVIEEQHENAFLTKPPMDLLKKGQFAKVPVLTGITSNEIALLGQTIPFLRGLFLLYEWSPATLPNQLNVQSVSRRNWIGREIRRVYFKHNSFVKATDDELALMLSDLLYVRPITTSARIMSKFIPVYFYVFNYNTMPVKTYLKNVGYPLDTALNGVGHIEDLVYIWKYDDLELSSEGNELRRKMTKVWSNFARYGNPTPRVDPLLHDVTWPKLPGTNDVPYLKIDGNFSLDKNFRLEFVNFLNYLSECER